MDSKYVAQFEDLKAFVKAQAGENAIKLMKLKEEPAKKNLVLQRLAKIREKVDQLTQEIDIGQFESQLGKDPSQEQQRQLQQVKQTLTSFLQQAGKQMKSSEEDLSTVIKIINLDEDLMQKSTNSLIIKLWNTILTSVGEFKKTYQTNQLEITQKLDVMDVKLDAIMDRIESGHNEMLLELYRMSKVQDMILDKPQEEEKKSDTLLKNCKYSEKIMKVLKERVHPNAYERFKMNRQQETEWRFKEYGGNAYEGEFLKGTDIKEGLGIYIWNNGDVSEGQWKNDQKHGYGEFYWADGQYYYGQHSGDKRNGYGVIYYNDGNKFAGGWKDDKRHGLGIRHYGNNEIQIGQYIDDKRDGQHIKITNNNDVYQVTCKMGQGINEKQLS